MNDKDTSDTVCSSGQSEDSKKAWPGLWGQIIRCVPTGARWVTWIVGGLSNHIRIRLAHHKHKRAFKKDNPPQNLNESIQFSVVRQPQSQSAGPERSYVKNLLRPSSKIGIISRHSSIAHVRNLFALLQTRKYLKPIHRSSKWSDVRLLWKNYLTPPKELVKALEQRNFAGVPLLCWYVDVENIGDSENLDGYIVRSSKIRHKSKKLLSDYFQQVPTILIIDNVTLPDDRLEKIEASLLTDSCILLFIESHSVAKLGPEYSLYRSNGNAYRWHIKSEETTSESIREIIDKVYDKDQLKNVAFQKIVKDLCIRTEQNSYHSLSINEVTKIFADSNLAPIWEKHKPMLKKLPLIRNVGDPNDRNVPFLSMCKDKLRLYLFMNDLEDSSKRDEALRRTVEPGGELQAESALVDGKPENVAAIITYTADFVEKEGTNGLYFPQDNESYCLNSYAENLGERFARADSIPTGCMRRFVKAIVSKGFLKNNRGDVRWCSCEIASHCGIRAVPYLVSFYLEEKDPHVKADIIEVLGMMGEIETPGIAYKDIVSPLIITLADTEVDVHPVYHAIEWAWNLFRDLREVQKNIVDHWNADPLIPAFHIAADEKADWDEVLKAASKVAKMWDNSELPDFIRCHMYSALGKIQDKLLSQPADSKTISDFHDILIKPVREGLIQSLESLYLPYYIIKCIPHRDQIPETAISNYSGFMKNMLEPIKAYCLKALQPKSPQDPIHFKGAAVQLQSRMDDLVGT